MKRLHRLTALLVKLQASKTFKVQEISSAYNVSERTVYRDLQALEEAGVPISYDPAIGYSLIEGYHLPPAHFTSEEASAIVTANAIIQQNSDSSLRATFGKAVDKVIAILKTHELEKATELEKRVGPSVKKNIKSSDNLLLLQKAITDFQVLFLKYKNASGAISEREIEPLAVYFTQNNWVVVAHCRLRNEIREFRTDRIYSLTPIEKNFPPNQFSLQDYFKKASFF